MKPPGELRVFTASDEAVLRYSVTPSSADVAQRGSVVLLHGASWVVGLCALSPVVC